LEEKILKSPSIAINPTVNPYIDPPPYIVAIERHFDIMFSPKCTRHELGNFVKRSLLA